VYYAEALVGSYLYSAVSVLLSAGVGFVAVARLVDTSFVLLDIGLFHNVATIGRWLSETGLEPSPDQQLG
jgi:hypothetical protein